MNTLQEESKQRYPFGNNPRMQTYHTTAVLHDAFIQGGLYERYVLAGSESDALAILERYNSPHNYDVFMRKYRYCETDAIAAMKTFRATALAKATTEIESLKAQLVKLTT